MTCFPWVRLSLLAVFSGDFLAPTKEKLVLQSEPKSKPSLQHSAISQASYYASLRDFLACDFTSLRAFISGLVVTRAWRCAHF